VLPRLRGPAEHLIFEVQGVVKSMFQAVVEDVFKAYPALIGIVMVQVCFKHDKHHLSDPFTAPYFSCCFVHYVSIFDEHGTVVMAENLGSSVLCGTALQLKLSCRRSPMLIHTLLQAFTRTL